MANILLENGDILFVCSNAGHVQIFLPVAKELLRRSFNVRFLSCDSYYAQGADHELAFTSFQWENLPSPFDAAGWTNYDWEEKKLYLDQLSSSVTEFFSANRISCVVLGNDTGAIEQYCIRCANLYDAYSVRVQDGRERAMMIPLGERVSKFILGDGGCDLVCVWSDTVACAAKDRGISSEIIVSGNPRFDVLADWPGYKKKSDTYHVVIATQCFATYHQMDFQQEIYTYRCLIDHILKRQDCRVSLKLHPSHNNKSDYFDLIDSYNGLVDICDEMDSIIVLRTTDLLLTCSSSVAIEAALMGVPTWNLDYLILDPNHPDFIQGEKNFLDALFSVRFPNCMTPIPQKLHESFEQCVARWVNALCLPPDGNATKRMADSIETLGERVRPKIKVSYPQVSVLMVYKDVKHLSSLKSVLRSKDVTIEVIVVDQTTDSFFPSTVNALQDDRVTVVHSDGIMVSHGIECGLSLCTGEIIVRVDPVCDVLPAYIAALSLALKQNPNAQVAISYTCWRNAYGIIGEIHTLPEYINLTWLVGDVFFPMYDRNFAFRRALLSGKSRTVFCSEPWDFGFLPFIISAADDPYLFTIVRRALLLGHV